jgi:hypothetical protein
MECNLIQAYISMLVTYLVMDNKASYQRLQKKIILNFVKCFSEL